MDRTSFAQQIHIAMIHANRKLRSAGLPASVMQIFIIVVFFVLLQSDSKYVLWFMGSLSIRVVDLYPTTC